MFPNRGNTQPDHDLIQPIVAVQGKDAQEVRSWRICRQQDYLARPWNQMPPN
jgi:hypothetical protein